MIIMKFGGSSVANSEQMLNVLEIIKKQNSRKIVVLSACQGITNKLETAANQAKNQNKEKTQTLINEIISHHIKIINNSITNKKIITVATKTINNYAEELNNLIEGIYLLKELTAAALDSVFAFGELLSSNVLHYICLDHAIAHSWLDARNLIITNSNFNAANPEPKIYENFLIKTVKKEFNTVKNGKPNNLLITQGFIASDSNGKTTTLGRGGSDLSASLIGAANNADEIQIWTDVDGILTADPKKIKNVKNIETMTFSEIRELSFWGAKVLHPKTILPAIEKNITVKVLNSFNQNSKGTIISANSANEMQISSVISKNNCYLLNFEIDETKNENISNFNDFFSINNPLNFNELNKGFESLYFGYNNGIFTLLFENNEGKNSFIKNINSEKIINSTTVAVICVSGKNLKSNSLKLGNFINSVLNCFEKIKLHQLIFQSDSSIIFVVDECELTEILEEIHFIIIENTQIYFN